MEAWPWLKQYDEGVPHTLRPYPDETLLDVVSGTTRQRPDHPALLFLEGARVSYAQLERLSDAFAAALVAQGVQKGDRVAILLINCSQFIIAQLGAWKAGAIPALINPLYTGSELEHMLSECGASTAVVLSRYYDKIQECRGGVRRIISADIKDFLPPHLRILLTLFRENREGYRATLQPGDVRMRDLLRQFAGAARPQVVVHPDDPALLLFTGGTTGTPKAALATHGELLAAGMQLRSWFTTVDGWEDTILLLMPLFHVYGNVGVLATGLVGRNPLALVPDPRDLSDVIDTIRKVRPSFLPGVPTLFNALDAHPETLAGKVDFSSIKLCISGAAPLLVEGKRRFEVLTGGRMIEANGLTESMLAAMMTREWRIPARLGRRAPARC